MDLNKAIRELYEEKKRIEAAIASLESMLEADSGREKPKSRSRRGRKSMSREERAAVSARMKKYWAARRAAANAASGGSAATQGSTSS
jgi:hypothetical protein